MDPRHKALRQAQEHGQQHQRFSWQTPPEEEAPPYEPPQQHPVRAETLVNTRDRAFSYARTPIEHRDPNYASSPTYPSLPQSFSSSNDPHSQPLYNASNPPPQSQSHPAYVAATPYPEKAPFSPASPLGGQHPSVTTGSPITQMPPIHTQPQNNHARKLSNLSPLNTNVSPQTMPPVPQIPQVHRSEAEPLPYKTPISPISSGPITHANNRTSVVAEPYSPHGFPTTPGHAVFSPHAAHGPNGLDFALHQPGQVAHPNMDIASKGSPHEWKHSLCECSGDCSTCMTGLFCPCILYGRTAYRLSQKSDKKDPTDMLGYSATNGHCMLMAVSCGLWSIFPMIQRTRLRHLYKITGSLGSDILKGCCCCCCAAIQNEREVRDREESSRRWAGPASTEVYTAPSQMMYKSQR